MNILRSIWTWFSGLFARYEGAQPNRGERSYIQSATQDARLDADSASRLELLRKARYFERNGGIVGKLCDVFEQFTVGPGGIVAVPASSDPEWNRRAREVWGEWSRFPDLVSLQPLGVLQSLIARSWFIDGEVFVVKTSGGPPDRRPRLQLIEGHRVATPPDSRVREGESIIDGVEIDTNGRPVGYWISEGNQPQLRWRNVPASAVIHVFEPSRPGQYRGITFLHAVLNDIHDLDDLQRLEMQAAKEAAQIANVVTNAAGELPPDMIRRQRFSTSTVNSQSATTSQSEIQHYREVLGARTIALRTGEDMKQFGSTRPSVAQQWYWDYLTSKICAGVGISKLLVYPWSMQGTVTRADLDTQAGFFRARSEIMAAALTQIWDYVMWWHARTDKRVADPPADWRRIKTRAPRAVNVDVGRNSRAMLDELGAGTRTYQDIYAEMGADWEEQLEQRAKEAARIKQLAAQYQVEPSEISTLQAQPEPTPEPIPA